MGLGLDTTPAGGCSVKRDEERARQALRRAAIARFGRFYEKWHPHVSAKTAPITIKSVPNVTGKRDSFLRSKRWRELRAKIIEERGAWCVFCGASPSDRAIIQVDHIKPRSLYPELAWDESNLQVLCYRCNKEKSAQDRWQESLELAAIPEQFRYRS